MGGPLWVFSPGAPQKCFFLKKKGPGGFLNPRGPGKRAPLGGVFSPKRGKKPPGVFSPCFGEKGKPPKGFFPRGGFPPPFIFSPLGAPPGVFGGGAPGVFKGGKKKGGFFLGKGGKGKGFFWGPPPLFKRVLNPGKEKGGKPPPGGGFWETPEGPPTFGLPTPRFWFPWPKEATKALGVSLTARD